MEKVAQFNDKAKEYEKRAKELVKQMTLEEKVFQTMHTAPAIPRLGIKAYNWWNEALHGVARAGVATVFPQAIGLAAAFDEDQIEKVADCISTEGRAKFNMQQKYGDYNIYKGITFWSPNVNVFRDPRWGRGQETYGEDPYLISRLGVRFIEGLQGNDSNYMKTAACAKHFAVHSGPEGERHSFDARVSIQDMYETYLPAFKACVQEAQVETVMGAYNRTNGEPCCASKTLLKDILRNRWGFRGHVTSDCWAIKDFYMYHHVANDALEAVSMAMNNGCDLNCGNQFIYLQRAVEEGKVKEEVLDAAVTRLFVTRMKLGMFDEEKENPFARISYEDVNTRENEALNLETAKKTIVLLKNEKHLLPLDIHKISSIGVIGPNANNRRALVGNYEGTAARYITVLEGIQDYAGEEIAVHYSEGCHLYKDISSDQGERGDRLAEAKAVCDVSDVVVVCLGLDSSLEGENKAPGSVTKSGDRQDIGLPGIQNELLQTVYECGKPVILVMLSGSAIAVPWADEHIPAIVQGWYPGSQGGKAIASILFGEYCPEGKLPITFYRTTEELPDFRDYSMKGRTYRYMQQEALYPFGFGLSYTSFELYDIQTDQKKISKGQGVGISCILKNTGDTAGAQTVQIYVKCRKKGTPNPQLKAWRKVFLQPGEERSIQMVLFPEAFGLYDEKGRKILYQGEYEIWTGMCQPDARSRKLTGWEPVCTVLCSDTEECIEE